MKRVTGRRRPPTEHHEPPRRWSLQPAFLDLLDGMAFEIESAQGDSPPDEPVCAEINHYGRGVS
ncbi:MAG: hypothetical protein M3Z25_01545 [Actinomycetota bacterium]|nr:hypothetical protein [Actinomycetota bacterium]